MTLAPQAGVVALEIPLRPDELIGAWRPDPRRLLLTAREPLRLRQRVAARISVVGRGVAATITGRVASASREGGVHRFELVPDDARIRAAERLLAVARGEGIEHQTRIPRFLATMPAVVYRPTGATYMTTFSVSRDGCGLAWSGPVPKVGAPIELRLGAGSQVATLRGAVCWTEQSGRSAMVGVRFVDGATNAWAMMLTEVKRSGAPLA